VGRSLEGTLRASGSFLQTDVIQSDTGVFQNLSKHSKFIKNQYYNSLYTNLQPTCIFKRIPTALCEVQSGGENAVNNG
jgi:hypothetical protein